MSETAPLLRCLLRTTAALILMFGVIACAPEERGAQPASQPGGPTAQAATISPDSPDSPGAFASLEIPVTDKLRQRVNALSPLPPPPADRTNRFADDPRAAAFGQTLFFDQRFSANGAVSCATCHDPDTGFTDGRQLAFGLSAGNRHTPTLWNVAYHRWLTWDGRADSLWMQALDPIEDPREMGTNRGRVALEIAEDPALRASYEDVFGPLPAAALQWGDATTRAVGARPRLRSEAPAEDDAAPDAEAVLPVVRHWEALDQPTQAAINQVFVHAGKAIAAYQRTLIRRDAPFDRFVEGLGDGDPSKLEALSPSAQRGLMIFLGKGNCTLCHNGPNFSDGEFHNNSLPTIHGGEPEDPGRYAGAAALKASPFHAAGPHSDDPTGTAAQQVQALKDSSESWGEFRTPSLRNLAHRGPFMHQGQFADLPSVIEFYSELEGASGRNHHQEQILVPLRLSLSEKADLLAFLESLNGQAAPGGLVGIPR